MMNKFTIAICITIAFLLLSACGIQESEVETPTTIPTIEVSPTKSIPTESTTPTTEAPSETEVSAPEDLLTAPVIYLGVEDQADPAAPGKQNLWRLEADGLTATQITDEAMPVTGFSVSPVNGAIVYTTFSDNDLYRINSDGSGRALLVDGPLLEGPPSGGPANQISNPVWSPDGEYIAYGGDGIRLIPSSGGEASLIIANEPQNVEPKEWINYYYPISWSPEGAQILVGDAVSGQLLILDVANGAITKVHNPSGEYYCCSPSWSLDGQSVYFGGVIFDPSIYQAPGLWRIDVNKGEVEVLLPGYEDPAAAQEGGEPLNLIQSVQQRNDGNLYALAAFGSYEEFWLDEAGNVSMPQLVMTRLTSDGAQPVKLRSDADQYGDALWALDASGAVTNLFGSDELPNGSLLWLPTDGSERIVLGGRGFTYQWGQTSSQITNDWNTYTNEKYGYSFDYPSDCTFGPMPTNCKSHPPEERPPECLCFLDSQNPDQVFMQAFLGEADELNLAGINVDHNDMPLFNPPPGTELVSWIKSELSQMHEDIPDEPNYEIDEMPAVRIHTPKSPMAPSYENIYFLLEGKLFNIQLLDVDNEGNKELYEQILASFHIEG